MQRTIEAAVEKRTKIIFGPPVGKKLIAFVDDMNMPRVDNYGTQQPIALLKLLVERGGMYDRGKELNWKMFKDICKLRAICECAKHSLTFHTNMNLFNHISLTIGSETIEVASLDVTLEFRKGFD